ncbi:MAG TPA: septum site-determining protein, partial [Casimicrobium sp.]|nr:septum site-determining protein [Casimicrobium sp.]
MTAPTVTASSALPAGTRLGEFEITGVVGEGGFGIVYSARDSSLDRIVAVKEYLPSAFASRNSAGGVEV